MESTEQMTGTAEKMARNTQESFRTLVEHSVGIQERNVRFAQGVAEASIKEMRQQAEANRQVTGELIQRAEGQREATKHLMEQSVEAYLDLLYSPLYYYREGMESNGKADGQQ